MGEIPLYTAKSVEGYEVLPGPPLEAEEEAPAERLAKDAAKSKLRSQATGVRADVVLGIYESVEPTPGDKFLCRLTGRAARRIKK